MNCQRLKFFLETMAYSNSVISFRMLELWAVGNQLHIPSLNKTLHLTINWDTRSLESSSQMLHFPPLISFTTSSEYSKPSSNMQF